MLLPAMREKVNVAPSLVRTIFSTYIIPDEYEPAVRLDQTSWQAFPGVTEAQVPVVQVGLLLGADMELPFR